MYPINIISYNLNYHVAYPELAMLTKKHAVDVLCLQECDTDDVSKNLGNLTLASKTTTGQLGLAIYYDKNRFSFKTSTSVPICRSIYEKIRIQDRERLLIIELFDRLNQQPFFVTSFHATHLIATNCLRRRQIRQAFEILDAMRQTHPAVLAGDFNYPFSHGKLNKTVQELNYHLITPIEPTYYGRKFRGRFDMAATTQLTATIEVLPFGLSDHSPILLHLTSKL